MCVWHRLLFWFWVVLLTTSKPTGYPEADASRTGRNNGYFANKTSANVVV